tara:strand:+ start:1155 stop:2135 length:981 start_codon:yes stop_codon:yes gene_type:complete
MKVGIIGCGLIGYKRANALNKHKIVGCFDKNKKLSKKFSENFNCLDYKNVNELIKNKDIDIVFICTFHNSLFKYTKLCLKNNKHILVEKPGAKNLQEISELIKLSNKYNKLKIHVGYNHRFHPSIISARKIINKNILGKVMYIRARYGHGARLNYNKEWRMIKKISGGGELIDQGSHLIDLSRLFLGELFVKNSLLKNFFWKTNVDDNAFLLLGNKKNEKVAFLHCSCTEWKNKFSFEIFLEYGKLEIKGIGGSYGVETLICYKMKKKMGIPKIKTWKFYKNDDSWKKEIDYFVKTIDDKKNSESDIYNAYENMKIIKKCYSNNKL